MAHSLKSYRIKRATERGKTYETDWGHLGVDPEEVTVLKKNNRWPANNNSNNIIMYNNKKRASMF